MINTNVNFEYSDDFINNTLENNKQVGVYGWKACCYTQLKKDLINQKPGNIETAYNVWDLVTTSQWVNNAKKTLEGRQFPFINWHGSYSGATGGMCKAGLVTIVLENCKRTKENLPPIPLLFVTSRSDWIFQINLEYLTHKEDNKDSNRITFQELRRVYKLMHHSNDLVRNVANQTFKFIHLERIADRAYSLVEVPAPWAIDEVKMQALMDKRKNHIRKTIPKESKYDWRVQVEDYISKLEN